MQKIPETLDFLGHTRDEIAHLLREYNLGLTVDEALSIQQQLLKRPPTFAECVLWSIQGSEHCSYKSSRKFLKTLNTTNPDVILGAKEDAGVITIATDHAGHRYGLVVSHESHNHPSQIVPYEGAATGVGGNVRDVCCMGAEVIAVADALRFGSLTHAKTHWIQSGVVAGIAGYGNPLGIPNVAGDVYFDPGYNENCLVTVVTLGIVREDHLIHSYAPKQADQHVFILVGKPTDNSGFGGASFASANLAAEEQEQNKGAVQEPNAFLQRHLLKANYALFQYLQAQNLIDQVGFKDLGAGGIACASVELAETSGYGAEIDVDLIPTGMPGLNPAVILCSETQERFMWVVPPELAETVLTHYNETFALPKISAGACATVVGKIRTDGQYIVKAEQRTIVQANAQDVTKGLLYDRAYTKKAEGTTTAQSDLTTDANATLLRLLAHENIASRTPIFENYDKQVQGRTVIEAGHADAGVLQPFNEDKYPEEIRQTGVAISLDQNPRYNKLSAYWGAVNAVVESARNVAAVGALPIAITDCLCFGNPEQPQQMGEFVAAVQGIKDACAGLTVQHATGIPVIAGNVSLYNETAQGAIPPSPMICCVGVIADVRHAVTYDFKQADSLIVMIGERQAECGGSLYQEMHGVVSDDLPKPDLTVLTKEILALHAAIQAGLVLAAHDIADGGIAVALAEMTCTNAIGIRIQLPGELPIAVQLFSETGGFVLEIAREQYQAVKKLFLAHAVPLYVIGETTNTGDIKMNDTIAVSVAAVKDAWENGLRTKL